MTYQALNFDNLLGTAGFSDDLLKDHFKLYNGYVANVNKVADKLKALFDKGEAGTPEFAEMKRRFGWEFNGMRLHELYFGNLSKEEVAFDEKTPFGEKVVEQFGSVDKLKEAMTKVGSMRGIGWTILYLDPITERLFVTWVAEHDMGHLSSCVPLLVMDVWEHAYMTDYRLSRADYISAFLAASEWAVVARRYDQALK